MRAAAAAFSSPEWGGRWLGSEADGNVLHLADLYSIVLNWAKAFFYDLDLSASRQAARFTLDLVEKLPVLQVCVLTITIEVASIEGDLLVFLDLSKTFDDRRDVRMGRFVQSLLPWCVAALNIRRRKYYRN